MTWILAAAIVLLLASLFLILVVVCSARLKSDAQRHLEDLEQQAALRAMRPGVCTDCGTDLDLVSYASASGVRCGSCMVASLGPIPTGAPYEEGA